jgi:hypothetical protein
MRGLLRVIWAGSSFFAAVAAKMASEEYAWLISAVHYSIAFSAYTNLTYDITKDF